MTSKTVLAYLLIAGYFVMERLLRQGDKALSLQAGEFDQGSSKVIWISGLLGIFLIVLAPLLNVNQIGDWDNGYFGWLGLLIMLGGLVLRYWAAKTLGEFYTRTLQTLEKQQIIQQAPYNIIRHPGYLGTFLMEIGACLAIANWVILIVIAVIGVLSRVYRIQVEEEMLKTVFGEQYTLYSQETWRLIPFIY